MKNMFKKIIIPLNMFFQQSYGLKLTIFHRVLHRFDHLKTVDLQGLNKDFRVLHRINSNNRVLKDF